MRTRAKVLLAAMLTLLACGRGGSSDGGSDDDADPSPPSSPTGPEAVTGSFHLGSAEAPASDFTLWLLNHTLGTFEILPLDDAGAFKVAIGAFTEGEIYTFHLIDDDLREIGPIDFSSRDGTQAGIQYMGGYGFDLGRQIVALTAQGEIDFASPGLRANAGGGFTLADPAEIGIDEFPRPHYLEGAWIDADLTVHDPGVLLHSFYDAGNNPDLYSQDLGRYAAIRAVFQPVEAGVSSVSFSQAGAWLSSSRLATSLDAGPAGAALWSASGHQMPEVEGEFMAKIFPGRVLLPGTTIVVLVRPNDREARQSLLPLTVRRAFSMPPKLVSLALDGGALGAIDYSDTSSRNGLTRPFCLEDDDVVLGVEAPLDLEGKTVSSLTRVEVDFDYFGTSGGAQVALNPKTSDFPSGFREPSEDEVDSIARSWDPEVRRARFDLKEAAVGAATHELTLWREIFLGKARGKTVTKIRLRLSYVEPGGVARSGGIVWFDLGC